MSDSVGFVRGGGCGCGWFVGCRCEGGGDGGGLRILCESTDASEGAGEGERSGEAWASQPCLGSFKDVPRRGIEDA